MTVTTTTHDTTLVIQLDDGARNALRPETFDAITAAMDQAGDEHRAIVITGREGALSAGLDVKWMAAASRDEIRDLLVRFGRCMMRIWTEPRPTVCSATGHALAGGTMIAMACDHAVAAEGAFAWGLTETTIDFEIPRFGLALASHNVAANLREDLLLPGVRMGPDDAVRAGFADEVAPAAEVLDRALQVAAERAELPARAYAGTKARLRGADAELVLANVIDDVDALTQHIPA